MMRNIAGWLMVLAIGVMPAAAQNLVPNGNFEDENICIEYNKNCAPEGWITTVMSANTNCYFLQASKAYEGAHFVGLTVGNYRKPDARNFIRARLLCGMQAGHQYELTFYVRSMHDVLDSVGIYFSENDFLFDKRSFKEVQPQLWATNALDTLYEDPKIWQKVRLLYTARGNEGFITIGCFNRKDGKWRGIPDHEGDYFFYLDAVGLLPVDKQEKLCPQADSVKQEIYAESWRHEMLRRYVYVHSRNPPPVKPLPKTFIPRTIVRKQHIDTLIIPDIFFATASYKLSPKSYHLLDSFSLRLANMLVDSLVIEGHTDSVGKMDYNVALSQNRAQAVKEYIEDKLPPPNDPFPFPARGYAFTKPVATNKTPAGRQKNRRVEIYVYRRD